MLSCVCGCKGPKSHKLSVHDSLVVLNLAHNLRRLYLYHPDSRLGHTMLQYSTLKPRNSPFTTLKTLWFLHVLPLRGFKMLFGLNWFNLRFCLYEKYSYFHKHMNVKHLTTDKYSAVYISNFRIINLTFVNYQLVCYPVNYKINVHADSQGQITVIFEEML